MYDSEINSRFDIIFRSLNNAKEVAEDENDGIMIDHIQHIRNEIELLESALKEEKHNVCVN